MLEGGGLKASCCRDLVFGFVSRTEREKGMRTVTYGWKVVSQAEDADADTND